MQNDNLTDESSDSDNSDSDDEEAGGNFALFVQFLQFNFWNISVAAINGRYKNVSQLEWDNTTM